VKAKALYMIMLMLVTSNLVAKAKQPPKTYPQTLLTNTGRKLTFDLVLIPGGQFQMGSSANEEMRKDDEGPQHTVKLDPFYLCTTETTLALFSTYYKETATAKREFVAISAKQKELEQAKQDEFDGVTGPTPVYGDIALGHTENFPAMAMSWRNAVLFCKWVSKRTGKTYRLPTEAEWEYACRAGSNQSFGNTSDPKLVTKMAWYVDNSDGILHEIGTKRANAYGLYDMMGNVREWVYDFYSPTGYKGRSLTVPVSNPTGPKQGKVHVARGGDHSSPLDEMRCSSRTFQERWWQSGDPQLPKSVWWLPTMDFIGFRMACSINPATPK